MRTPPEQIEISQPAEQAAAASPVLWWLRAEGLAVAVATGYIYYTTGVSWRIFGLLWLLPDLSAAGYLAGPRWGSRIYNLAHSYVPVGALALVGWSQHMPALLPFALVWCNHIGVDRLLGYGLKYPTAFGHTHLGRLGKARLTENSSSAPAPRA